ncbi:MAG: BACON domain-containing protein, partial [Desulfobacterales bacterium]|nr:BACON domain-containing protein [Desulfobacterales bacterium]
STTTITMNANKNVTANFIQSCTASITATAGTGGSISPSGVANVTCGSSKTYTISPDAGYKLFDVEVNGSSVGGDMSIFTSYTFTNVTTNQTIKALFIKDEECGYSLFISPDKLTYSASRETIYVEVDTLSNDCPPWTAISNDPWISIESESSGSASGYVDFSIEENTETYPRTGSLIIAGQTVTITQSSELAIPFPEEPVGFYPTTLSEIASAPVNVGTLIDGDDNGITLSGYMQLDIYFPEYDQMVDIYVGIGLPPDSINAKYIWLVDEWQDIVSLSKFGFVKYAEKVTGPTFASIINDFTDTKPMSNKGEWLAAWIVLPTGTDVNQVDWMHDPALFGWYFFNVE